MGTSGNVCSSLQSWTHTSYKATPLCFELQVADASAVLLIRLLLLSMTKTLMLFDRSNPRSISSTRAQVPSI